ncbi:NPCBM/NEW2 domain-containing protein [Kitasatospora herbaricolor]|uniref:NPCBM/NEW2 domain-containing protein n=1 Tax=Kitasatospora herbaricolor TaxID=68217 RepID=A0ABZ1WHV1_9ACTN|nr:NPCBM/NEW2 domain-containing protein [Kitasatospora herbaricolor]
MRAAAGVLDGRSAAGPGARVSLYDLASDLGEQHDRADPHPAGPADGGRLPQRPRPGVGGQRLRPGRARHSNGCQEAGDGTPASFAGTTYAKGPGVHAPSEVGYHLGARGGRFTALVGIDDFSTRKSALGATKASVRGDGKVLFSTGKLTGVCGPVEVDVDVRGVRLLQLASRTPTATRPSTTPPGPGPG